MRFGFGLITCQRPPYDERTDAEIYREAVDLCVQAEALGFDSVWTSEHHFLDDGYMPSLLVFSAAVAQATSRIGIGTGVVLAPLHDPLRLAEDAATVDLISGGRFTLGLGASWRAEELEVFGVAPPDRVGRLRECVRILRGAWGPEPFSFTGRHWRLEDVNVTPKPAHPIPIWLGGFARPAVFRAGRIADGFLGSSTGTAGAEAFAMARQTAEEGRRASGRDGEPFTFALHVPVFAWEGADAWEVVRPHYHYLRWKYPDMGAARGRPLPPAAPPPLTAAEEAELRQTIICGTPGQVVEGIRVYRDTVGDDVHFICRSYFAGMPADVQRESLRVLAEKVLPAFA